MTGVDALAAARRPHPEQLAEAIDRAREFFGHFVYAANEILDVATAFVAYARVWPLFDTAVYLNITSPTRRCGKTRFREVLEVLLGDLALSAGSITPAALVRAIEKWRPVLILDEGDGIDGLGEEGAVLLRSILNEGFRSNGAAIRCVGRDHEPVRFSAFCPKILIGIGEFLPPTVRDRCIRLGLQRKPAAAVVSRFRMSSALAEAAPVIEALNLFRGIAPPEVAPLGSVNDRFADATEPLLAVAAAAGAEWEARVRRALEAIDAPDAKPDLAEETLTAVASIFQERGVATLGSQDLCSALNEMSEGRWQELRRGQGANPRWLAETLRPFGIAPRNVRLSSGEVLKGYQREEVLTVAAAYGFDSATPLQGRQEQAFPSSGTSPAGGDPLRGKANEDKDCSGVADQNRGEANTSVKGNPRAARSAVADCSGYTAVSYTIPESPSAATPAAPPAARKDENPVQGVLFDRLENGVEV